MGKSSRKRVMASDSSLKMKKEETAETFLTTDEHGWTRMEMHGTGRARTPLRAGAYYRRERRRPSADHRLAHARRYQGPADPSTRSCSQLRKRTGQIEIRESKIENASTRSCSQPPKRTGQIENLESKIENSSARSRSSFARPSAFAKAMA